MKKQIHFALILVTAHFVYGQKSKIDSLNILLKTEQDDTNKVNTLCSLASEFRDNNPDTSIILFTQALHIAEKLRFEKGIAKSNHNLGWYNVLKGNYSLALDYYFKALKIREALNDKKSVAQTLSNIGSAYELQANYPEALAFYFKALKIGEEGGNKKEIARGLRGIGNVYTQQGDYSKALEYFFKALKIGEELGNKIEMAVHFNSIGIAYYEQKNYAKALEYWNKALKISEELGNKNGIAALTINIGNVHSGQRNYTEALYYYSKGLKVSEEIGNTQWVGNVLNNMGSLYTLTGKFKQAEEYLLRSAHLFDSIKSLDNYSESEKLLSNLYDTTGRFRLALEHYRNYITSRDTIFSQDNKKKSIRTEMNFEFEKKEAILKEQQEKERVVAEEKNRKQTIITWSVVGGLLLVLLFSGFIFRSLRITRKQKRLIELQKTEVIRQKELVEVHQKEIIDSINYSKRLQEAILPPKEYMQKHLPDSWLVYMPKDIVAGDFYFMEVIDDIIFIAAADSTGHGIPGCLVSVVCSNALNRAVKEFGLRDTGRILDKVTELVIETFEKSDEDVKDGMDISLLSINNISQQIQWSGANNPLWYIQDGTLKDITANKQPIGKHDNHKPFTSHIIPYQSNTTFFLFTDGYADQFGGEKGKKFKYKQLEEKLLASSGMALLEQKEFIERTFINWRGKLEQVDDVCIIGIRIT